MKFLKMYGLHRTGSNYTQWLIENNFKNVIVLRDVLGWKHGPAGIDWTMKNWISPHTSEEEHKNSLLRLKESISDYLEDLKKAVNDKNIGYIFCFKHPYSWLKSNSKIKDYKGLNEEKKLNNWSNRNLQYIDFIKNNEESSVAIKYEDYYNFNYKHQMEKIRDKFNLERDKDYIDTKSEIGPLGGVQPNSFKNYRFYKEKRYLRTKIKNNNLNKEVMNYLGYSTER